MKDNTKIGYMFLFLGFGFLYVEVPILAIIQFLIAGVYFLSDIVRLK